MKHTLTAFVLQRGKVIAQAHNLGAHGLLAHSTAGYQRSVHAEQRAAKLARGKLERGKSWGMLVIRYRKDGTRAISKPCPLCVAYLAGAGCAWVDYWDRTGNVERLRLI